MTKRIELVQFTIEDQVFGMDILLVREVNRQINITPVQKAPDYVRGLINLRGQIVTILDLGQRMDLGERIITDTSRIIILKTESEVNTLSYRTGRNDLYAPQDPVGLLVDSVLDVMEVDLSDIEPPPANIHSIDRRFLSGVIRQEAGIVLVLSAEMILNKELRPTLVE